MQIFMLYIAEILLISNVLGWLSLVFGIQLELAEIQVTYTGDFLVSEFCSSYYV